MATGAVSGVTWETPLAVIGVEGTVDWTLAVTNPSVCTGAATWVDGAVVCVAAGGETVFIDIGCDPEQPHGDPGLSSPKL